ncbi:segregation/condensation protein A [Streptomyces sp. 6N223]|uniref:segregation/condensation protein A n=1 Tax=Streptomyces sp. 6N223 TaxID=3457412 RepID=UPI003FD3FFA2
MSGPEPRRRALGRGPGTAAPPARPPEPHRAAETAPSAGGEPPAADPAPAIERAAAGDPATGVTPAPRSDSAAAGDRAASVVQDTARAAVATDSPPGSVPAQAAEDPAPAVPVSAADLAPDRAGGPAHAADVPSPRRAPAPGRDPAGGEATAADRGAFAAATDPLATDPPATGEAAADDARFRVVLENFEGPFDLLLQLISKHRLDVTEVALSRVTDDFMAHIRAMGPDFDLDQTTEFLVVAATLLDLKAARLLPAAEVEDEADLALLEARDLLFARLLQYRAYKRVADIFSERLSAEALRHPRTVGLEPHHAQLLPDVVISLGAEGFARLAVKAMQPKPKPQVYVDHIHAPLVSVREQAEVLVARLRASGEARFAELVADAPDTLTVVARFLALLELYRERAVALDQEQALGPLTVRWCGPEEGPTRVTDEFDRQPDAEAGEDEPGEGEPGEGEQEVPERP